MSNISPMVQCRIPEDHLMALDQMVGLDGMRTDRRIRLAVRQLMKHLQNERLEELFLDLDGFDRQNRNVRSIHGDSPHQVTRAALRTHEV